MGVKTQTLQCVEMSTFLRPVLLKKPASLHAAIISDVI